MGKDSIDIRSSIQELFTVGAISNDNEVAINPLEVVESQIGIHLPVKNSNCDVEISQPATPLKNNRFRVVKRNAPGPFTRGRWNIVDKSNAEDNFNDSEREIGDLEDEDVANEQQEIDAIKPGVKNEISDISIINNGLLIADSTKIGINRDIRFDENNPNSYSNKVVQALDLVKNHILSTMQEHEHDQMSKINYLKTHNKNLEMKISLYVKENEKLKSLLDFHNISYKDILDQEDE
ncbi:MAG: hypothetical protein MHMPM18_002678 [Marteilia pararefringens]